MEHRFDGVPISITEAYIGYAPPIDLAQVVARLLRTVPPKYLVGLDCVVLTNLSGQPRRMRLGTLPRKGKRVQRSRVKALYHPEWKGHRAWIEIYADKLEPDVVRFRWLPLLRDLVVAQVLFHELGHHAHRLRPEHRPKEAVAEDWGDRFMGNYARRRYWYALPVLLPLAWLYRAVTRKTR